MAKKDHVFNKIISNKERKNPAVNPQQSISGKEGSIIESSCQFRRIDQSMAVSSHSFEQTMKTGQDGTISNSSQSFQQNLHLADRDYYFDLKILEKSGENEPDSLKPISISSETELKSAQVYIVRVSASLNSYQSDLPDFSVQLKQNPIKVSKKLRLFIQEDSINNSEKAIEYISGKGEFTVGQENDWYCDFEIKIKPQYTITSTKLNLIYLASQYNQPRVATTVTISLENLGLQVLPDSLCCYFPTNVKLPDNTAILHIYPLNKKQLNLMGWVKNFKDRKRKLYPIERLKLSSSCYSNQELYLKAIEEAVNDFAIANQGNLAQWFDSVLKLYPENCCIIIVDLTDYKIPFPWEMFKLSNGEYLGTLALMVRWTEAQYYGKQVLLPTDKIESKGRVVTSFDSHPQDIPILNQLTSCCSTSPSNVQDYLGDSLEKDPVGLVYMQHSTFLCYGDEQLARNQLPTISKSPQKCRFDYVAGRLNSKPLFFVNSPSSGHILWSGQKACGLINAILTQVGSGCIGTLGYTHPQIATWIAKRFLREANSQNGVSPADFLKQLRLYTVNKLRNANQHERKRAELFFLYIFMYVYYGNPQAKLKVVPECSNLSGGGDI